MKHEVFMNTIILGMLIFIKRLFIGLVYFLGVSGVR